MRFLKRIPILYNFARKIKSNIKSCLLKIDIKSKKKKGPLKIVVGAGRIYEDGWIPTEINQLNLLCREDWEKFFDENTLHAILAEHVWEHMSEEEGLLAAENSYKYLKPKTGYIRIAVPDGYHPNPEYIDAVKINGTGSGASDHKVLYNYESLSRLFQSVGFDINLLEYYDTQGEFHYFDWKADDGLVHRSKRYDERNKDGKLVYTSLILDAIKK